MSPKKVRAKNKPIGKKALRQRMKNVQLKM